MLPGSPFSIGVPLPSAQHADHLDTILIVQTSYFLQIAMGPAHMK